MGGGKEEAEEERDENWEGGVEAHLDVEWIRWSESKYLEFLWVWANAVSWRWMYGGVFIDEGWLWFGRLREKWVNSNGNFSILLDLIGWLITDKKMMKEPELPIHEYWIYFKGSTSLSFLLFSETCLTFMEIHEYWILRTGRKASWKHGRLRAALRWKNLFQTSFLEWMATSNALKIGSTGTIFHNIIIEFWPLSEKQPILEKRKSTVYFPIKGTWSLCVIFQCPLEPTPRMTTTYAC